MRFLLMVLLMSSACFGQLSVTTKVATQIEFTVPPRLVGSSVLFDSKTRGKESIVAFISVRGPSETIDIVAERFVIVDGKVVVQSAEVKPVGEREYAISGSGTYSVTVIGFGPGISRVPRFEIALEEEKPPAPPLPPIPPTPDVGPDEFDNIGQRIAKWSAGLPKRVEVGKVFIKYAAALGTDPTMDITKAMTAVSSERVALLGADAAKYNECVDKLNADIKARWPMSKGVLADYLRFVGLGFGAK